MACVHDVLFDLSFYFLVRFQYEQGVESENGRFDTCSHIWKKFS